MWLVLNWSRLSNIHIYVRFKKGEKVQQHNKNWSNNNSTGVN